ncbi:uncharacterized protein BP01DRAFT_357811 [Aspergillus saccharolyticus JOP 1030-1]|uniref:Uncharacterized protein n=1 Tax=Aspergillus saccharolyticus JOP 1030-1 TaxID=1450539 RepID=A0A319AB69_9EURO|nr:hypothetical protein BP01DRAFT_357811 [Aspergillus saccharolyticus JOP 1030-1]PYH44192.1 hypothetical protein BP01DRAFT_357811 [Aspergillus saccharolyticus JOP 1030-1]
MGESDPPYLYDSPVHHQTTSPRFYSQPFNPKAVTEASWAQPEPQPEVKAPLVGLNRHPDSYYNVPDRTRWTPMSPHTKSRVIYGRQIQLGLRVLALIGALGSLFCSIVIKNAATTVIWIVRVGPAVAILHNIYSIWYLWRSAITRPPGSQASYMLFAGTLDLGLVPYYIFAAFLGYRQWTDTAWNWQNLLSSELDVTTKIAESTFLLSVVNGGLHLISLGICIFLGIIFHKIRKLPPDMNPLEDNLTARPLKRSKSEIIEKHASLSTLDTDIGSSEEPLITGPRTVPFMHTRDNMYLDGFSRYPPSASDKRHSQYSQNTQRMSRAESVPQLPFQQPNDIADDVTVNSPIDKTPDIFTRPTTTIPHGSPVREPSPAIPPRSQCVSPASDNWIVYPSRSATPAEDENEHPLPREPSSAYSAVETLASAKNGVMEWFSGPQRHGQPVGQAITEDVRGEYESIAANEYYSHNHDDVHDFLYRNGLYDSAEQDLGDHRIDIFQDHDQEHDYLDEETRNSLRVNPLALNPPTPQPKVEGIRAVARSPSNSGRMALTDIPNLSPNLQQNEDASAVEPTPKKSKTFYGDVALARAGSDRSNNNNNNINRKPSLGQKLGKFTMSRSQKRSAYGALKQHDDDANDYLQADPVTLAGDRKGRVVSNSGADFGGRAVPDTHPAADPNASSSISYGNYLAGLGVVGVGRRRDVSGKIAEEGRAEASKKPGVEVNPVRGDENVKPVRAAGWARFAGL